MKYTQKNAQTWDRWVEEGIIWGIPIDSETFIKAKEGLWDVYLTPTKPVPKDWFLPFQGIKILGLASGGGQQMPIFSALGAECTVLDYSLKQLESERLVSQREGYSIEIIQADMTEPLPFEEESFDLIFHPVSSVYVEKVEPILEECYRVLKYDGVLLAGFDNGLNFLIDVDEEPLVIKNKLPFHPLKNEEHRILLEKEDGGLQFSHSLEEQITGQLKAGFRLTDLYEDKDLEGALKEYAPAYYATRSVKEKR